MKVIPKLQQGNTIESDNTKVVRPEIHEPIKAKPRQYSIVDLGGEPSNDTRSAAERNRDYWHPIKGAKARFRASMSNETNPLVGIERTILPSAAGAALVTTPAAVVGGALGNMTVDKLTGGWGNWLEDKTGIPSEIGVYTNPGAWYGGAKGYKIGKDKLITKSIKGDADLAWNPINKNHWIFNKEARTPSNIAMATANRITPFLSKVEKLPLKVAAYKAAKRTNGKRDMRKKFIKSSRPTYKKRIKKAQQGMKFVSYNPISNPTIDYKDITNPINPFSEYNYNTTYDKPEALVVPVRDTDETDVVANNPTVEPVINKPVASKPVTDKPVTKTANSTWKSPYTNGKQWSTELINAYKKAGITNDNAIRMLLAQDALESSWGKSAQGKYNFGNLTTGSSWKGDYVTGNDKNAKGEAIKQKFRSYNSMDEYAADKIQFLKRLYDFDENDDINKFVAKLTGSNKGKRRYAEATNYAKVLTGIYNGIPKGENGMIIKYQNPAQPIARRDATYVAPKMYAPRPYKTKEEEIIEQNRNSEMISIPAHTTIGMVDGKLQVIDTPARQITNVGAGYLSGTDPVGEFVVGNVVAGKPLMWLGKGVEYGAARVGSQLARNRIVGRAINNSEIKTPSKMINNSAKTIQAPVTTNTKRTALFNAPTTTIKRSGTSPYREIGRATEPKSKSRLEHISVDSPMFGDYIDNGSQQVVFNNAANPNRVLKVLTDRQFTSVPEIKEFHKQWMKRNRLPLQERITFEGYLQGDGRIYPVYSQNRISTLGNILPKEWEKVHLPKLNKEMNKLGYKNNEGIYTNGKLTVGDVSPRNVGYVNGNIRFIDADVYKKGGKLPPS